MLVNAEGVPVVAVQLIVFPERAVPLSSRKVAVNAVELPDWRVKVVGDIDNVVEVTSDEDTDPVDVALLDW